MSPLGDFKPLLTLLLSPNKRSEVQAFYSCEFYINEPRKFPLFEPSKESSEEYISDTSWSINMIPTALHTYHRYLIQHLNRHCQQPQYPLHVWNLSHLYQKWFNYQNQLHNQLLIDLHHHHHLQLFQKNHCLPKHYHIYQLHQQHFSQHLNLHSQQYSHQLHLCHLINTTLSLTYNWTP